MPLGKRTIILSLCAVSVALFLFETRVAEAQSCPVCTCGTAVCDADGNCTCPQQPTCECAEIVCNSEAGQWECEEEDPPQCDTEHCWAPVCEDDEWECVYDGSECEDGVLHFHGPLGGAVVPVI